MSLASSRHPTSRFFAAFYRWNRYTYECSSCPLSQYYSRPKVTNKRHTIASRSFTSTRVHQQTQNVPQQAVIKEPRATVEDFDERKIEDAKTLEYGEQHKDAVVENEVLPEDALFAEGEDAIRASVRHIMRNVPYPVVILTAAHLDPESNNAVPLGIAVSSFNTVTLDPPTVSFNVRQPSRTLDAIKADGGRFRVHFLASEPQAASLANSFTQGNTQAAFEERRKLSRIQMFRLDAGTGERSLQAAEIIHDVVVASLQCKLTQEMTVADHVIVAAKVTDVKTTESKAAVLIYCQGNYLRNHGVPLQAKSI